MRVRKVIEEHYVCDICRYERDKSELHQFYHSFRDWLGNKETYTPNNFDICKYCLKEIRLLMKDRRAKE